MSTTLHIKNMVCPRCIMAVDGVFKELGLNIQSISLGEVILIDEIDVHTKKLLGEKLESLGFELLETSNSALISKIKSLIIQQVHYSEEPLKVNFSTYLSDNLHHDYSHLSRLFSSVEGVTIEKFITNQKIERVKELLFYNELSLSEIADKMDYSSVSHLSAQFKKETGMTPTQFKKERQPRHNYLSEAISKS